mgnify:CR=1 FL=1
MGFRVEDFLAKIPRPNLDELFELYEHLDEMVTRAAKILSQLSSYDRDSGFIDFSKMTERELLEVISEDPYVFVPLFTTICGLSIREFERLYGVRNIYSLRERFLKEGKKEKKFVKVIKSLLSSRLHIETILYKFYKNWEEHQKRHERGRSLEEKVRQFFRDAGYNCEKIDSPVEVDAAIPSDNPMVVMPIRTGVIRDLDKRAKEFATEFREIKRHFPRAKFVVIFGISKHELSERDLIRRKIEEHGPPEGYDAIVFHDELESLLSKFEEWKIPRISNSYTSSILS